MGAAVKSTLLLIGPKVTYEVLRYDAADKILTLIRQGVKPGRRMRGGKIKGSFTTKYDSARFTRDGYTMKQVLNGDAAT